MPFTSLSRGRQLEAAETLLLRRAAEAIRTMHPDEPIGIQSVGAGLAVYAGPVSPMNKVAGLGFAANDAEGASALPPESEMQAAEEMFFAQGVPVQVELSSLADPAVLELLTNRGYRPIGFEYASGKSLSVEADAVPVDHDGLEVVEGDDVDPERWLDILVDGFGAPDAAGVASHQTFSKDVLRRSIGDFSSARGMRRYVAVHASGEGTPVAAGAMMLTDDGIAQLCGAATLPAFRGQGAQQLLLKRRLRDAVLKGCTLATVTTQPGSTSLKNMTKQGFEILYVRLILVLNPPA